MLIARHNYVVECFLLCAFLGDLTWLDLKHTDAQRIRVRRRYFIVEQLAAWVDAHTKRKKKKIVGRRGDKSRMHRGGRYKRARNPPDVFNSFCAELFRHSYRWGVKRAQAWPFYQAPLLPLFVLRW